MKIGGIFVLLMVLAAGAAGFLVYAPFGPSGETFVDIPAGTGTAGIHWLRDEIFKSKHRATF